MNASPVLSYVAGGLMIAAVAVLFGAITASVALFSPKRARAVRVAEGPRTIPADRITALRMRHPELIRAARIDRHPAYILLNVGLWMYGSSVVLAQTPNSSLSMLSWGTQYALGVCLLTGATFTLLGALMGARIGRWRIIRRVSDNSLAELLGDDVTMPYVTGMCGLLSIFVSMYVYAETVITTSASRLLGTLGGGFSITTAVTCVVVGGLFLWRAREYTTARALLEAEANEGPQ